MASSGRKHGLVSPRRFIKDNLALAPVPGLPDIELYTAHSGSRLSRLEGEAPYWAYAWAGGLALAHYLIAHPEPAGGRRVLDLGAGSGLVGIVAAKLGAQVSAAEIDAFGKAAITLNAAANGVEVTLVELELDGSAPEGFDLIVAGDVFYNEDVAALMLPFLQRCASAGIAVLIGDPGRRDLPLDYLEPIAAYAVGDVGDARVSPGSVYRLNRQVFPHAA